MLKYQLNGSTRVFVVLNVKLTLCKSNYSVESELVRRAGDRQSSNEHQYTSTYF